jgi:hypothetical protein
MVVVWEAGLGDGEGACSLRHSILQAQQMDRKDRDEEMRRDSTKNPRRHLTIIGWAFAQSSE